MRPLALACALACAACGPKLTVKRERPLGTLAVRAVAVYPYAFRWDEPAHHSFEKAMDAVAYLVGRNRLLVYGPGDFRVLRPDEDNVQVATDLLHVLAEQHLDPRAFIVFRGWAEKRVATGQEVVTGKAGKRVGAQSSEEVTYVAHLDVIDGGAGEALFELTGEAESSPFDDKPDYDPMPELTELNRRLVAEAWSRVEGALDAPRLRRPPLEVRWLPAAELDWAGPGQKSLKELMLSLDALDADAQKLEVYRYWNPEADDDRLARDLRMPGGLYVERALPPAEAVLRRGDVITHVDGEEVNGPQTLQRAVNLAKDGAVTLRVARDFERVEVTLPASGG